MDIDPVSVDLMQPALWKFTDFSTGALELFPTVWNAAEDLTSPDVKIRQSALERLLELKAHRLSPLVAYLLATRLIEPDVSLRARVIEALGNLFVVNGDGLVTPEGVRHHLMGYLAQMRTRTVFSILEVAASVEHLDIHIFRLLNACPYAGNHLADILAERKHPLSIRSRAAYYIGKVGYLDALPTLERIATRLEARLLGQQAMPFAPSGQDEVDLLPAVQEALRALREP
jgi:hypothetical protein